MRILLFLSESTPCSHCHIGNLCDSHISIALLIGAKSHISHSYTEHAQFLAIFRELLNTSHFWKRRMLSAHRWFHLLSNNGKTTRAYLPVGLRCRSCFALYFQSLGSKFHLTNAKRLSIHGARLIHHMPGTLLLTSCSSVCCFVKAPRHRSNSSTL